MSEFKWTANADYVMESTGAVCTVSGRTYKKVNEGKALVGAYYTGFTGPILVSTDKTAVTYNAGPTFTYIGTIEYLGQTWYISNTQWFMEGNQSVSGFAKKISNDKLTYTQAAQLLFELANVREVLTTQYLIESDGIYYNPSGEAVGVVELNADAFQTYGRPDIPTGEVLAGLVNPKVYAWSPEALPIMTATVQGVPTGAHTVTSDHIKVNHTSIYGISSVVATASDGATFLLSFDGGEWMKYNDGTWSASDIGMTAAELMAIPSTAWSSVINSAQYMQLKATLEGVETVTQVVFNYNNESPTS